MEPIAAPQAVEDGGSKKASRDTMPQVTAFIDDLRAAYGKEEVDNWIKQGLREGTFWAEENGIIVGSKPSNL